MARKQYDDDDGRRIADMNVDGMPWYSGGKTDGFRKKQEPDVDRRDSGGVRPEPLTKKETRGLILNALLAALLIGSIFIAAGALFILFCVYVWFR